MDRKFGVSGFERLVKFASDLLNHYDWTMDRLSDSFAIWEREFYDLLVAHERPTAAQLAELKQGLVNHGRVNSDLRVEFRALDWLRWFVLRKVIDTASDDVEERTRTLTDRSDALAASMRDGFALIASEEAELSANMRTESEKRDRAFQFSAGFIASLLLAPAIVLSAFGIGRSQLTGFSWISTGFEVLVLSLIASLLTAALAWGFYRVALRWIGRDRG